jgi:signal transduction histidine kinase
MNIHQGEDTMGLHSSYQEFSEIIQSFNAQIDRLHNSIEQATRFSNDVSHELRAPLTTIRGHIDRLLQRAEDNSAQQIGLAVVSDEVERIINIMDKLWLLTRADAGDLLTASARINFSERLLPKVQDLSIDSDSLDVTSRIAPEIYLLCDEALIDLLLNNLFNNAVKYNHPQGWIHVCAQSDSHNLLFSIYNTTHLSLNSGMDERVFDRFYRHRENCDQSISSATGSGLGLSLCREIVKAHGGTIHLKKGNDLSVGFEVSLPLG